jgi:hypothetical protein
MPLNQQTLLALQQAIEAINNDIFTLCGARDDVQAMIRINADIPDANCLLVVQHAKERGKAAAQAIEALLS